MTHFRGKLKLLEIDKFKSDTIPSKKNDSINPGSVSFYPRPTLGGYLHKY